MEFKIGSFNMYKMNYHSDKEIKKDLAKISDIIKGEDFDIVAMQEVFSEGIMLNKVDYGVSPAAGGLMRYLGNADWGYAWKSPVSKSANAAEGYAFIWKKSKFRLATGMRKDEANIDPSKLDLGARRRFNARIEKNYQPDNMLFNGKLIRDPFYARFESVNGWFEVRLINTHIIFKENSKDETISESDVQKRKREFAILTDIYSRLADKQYRNGRPSYTFLLGDYNLNLKGEWKNHDGTVFKTKFPYVDEVVEIIDRSGHQKRIKTVQHELTTLKTRSKDQPDVPVRGFSNNYDHFSYDVIRFDSLHIRPKARRIDTVRKYCKDDFERHRREVSDHIPISLTVDLREEY